MESLDNNFSDKKFKHKAKLHDDCTRFGSNICYLQKVYFLGGSMQISHPEFKTVVTILKKRVLRTKM